MLSFGAEEGEVVNADATMNEFRRNRNCERRVVRERQGERRVALKGS